ncbi:eukaryotic membrane protein family-domain-containing protein [Papiliotrema laurentii]|uniref:Eukaryotic membrane protein family-domain-containing protein n=1 Tax=Papiliotrema laurentii TaxID=5418 RepID=A0AAD9CU10_PAPLA|nr:eukaryotic membrane protein family-domain-containing protein [Papiliotrema laurentii]
MPALTRQTTYSSLPPSPRIEAAFDFGVSLDDRSLQDLEHALYEIRRKAKGKYREEDVDNDEEVEDCEMVRIPFVSRLSPEPEGGDREVDQVEETFWPARSRRQTLDTLPDLSGIPDIIRRTTVNGNNAARDVGERHNFSAPENGAGDDGYIQQTVGSPVEASSSEEEKVGSQSLMDDARRDHTASLWDILRDDAGEEIWDGWVADGKWERIANFLAVPLAVEKVTLFGALLCLDGFLYNFTVLPVRASFAVYRLVSSIILQRRSIGPIPPSHLHSVLRLLLVVVPTSILLFATDASKMYHTVRGQDTIKLYVIFNALEIADRLCGAFGQDVLDTLFAKETLSPSLRKSGKGRKRQQARPVFFFMLSLGYVLTHTLIFFYMLVSLNVAINSYDYTLLSLLISNQFVEIKGSVFKKFEKENLFQIMCADIVERFQLALMLTVIAIRNIIEMAGSDVAYLPKSFIKGKSLVDSIFSPVLIVILSEMLVDWLKHAFIAKFNHVRASVYDRFTDVLAKDVLVAGSSPSGGQDVRRRHPILLDQSPLVARRLGFASIPLACLVLRVGVQALGMLTTSSHEHDESHFGLQGWAWGTIKWTAIVGVGLSAWSCLVALKILLGLSLLSFSAVRQAGMEEREREDKVNDFGRAPVGESKEETAYNQQTKEYLGSTSDDLDISGRRPLEKTDIRASYASSKPDDDKKTPPGTTGVGSGAKKGKKWKLEEVERWTMVKRIW